MLIGILEIASIASRERLVCRFENRGSRGFGLVHQQVNFFFAPDSVGQGNVRRTGSVNRQVSVVSDACGWPQSQLDPVFSLKEDDCSLFECLPNHSLCGQTKPVSIEGQRPIQIIDAQGNDRHAWFHGGTLPFLSLGGDHGFPEAKVLQQKQQAGQQANGCVQGVISSTARVYRMASSDFCQQFDLSLLQK